MTEPLRAALAELHRWDVGQGWTAFNAILARLDDAVAAIAVTDTALTVVALRAIERSLAALHDEMDGRFDALAADTAPLDECGHREDEHYWACGICGHVPPYAPLAADTAPLDVDWHSVASELAPETLTEWEAVVARHTR